MARSPKGISFVPRRHAPNKNQTPDTRYKSEVHSDSAQRKYALQLCPKKSKVIVEVRKTKDEDKMFSPTPHHHPQGSSTQL